MSLVLEMSNARRYSELLFVMNLKEDSWMWNE